MTSEVRQIDANCTVQIEISDRAPADWLSRVTVPGEFPYWNADGSPFTEAQGIRMLVYNALANGVEDVPGLDGWADLEPGMVTMRVTSVEAYL